MIKEVFVYIVILFVSLGANAATAVQLAPNITSPPGTMDNSTMQMGSMDMTAHPSSGQDEDAANVPVTITLSTPSTLMAGKPTILTLSVHSPQTNTHIPTNALEIVHEKPLHLVGVRSDLNEFFHIHPTPTTKPGELSTEYTFTKPGTYWLWSEVTIAGQTLTVRHKPVIVTGSGPTNERYVNIERNVLVGDWQVLIDPGNSLAIHETSNFTLHVHTKGGQEVALENYLGSTMHLNIVNEDGTQYVHAHPLGHVHTPPTSLIPTAHADTNHGTSFAVMFHQPGLYRAFAQFRPKDSGLEPDQAIVIPLWLELKEKKNTGQNGQANPWKYISLVLIGVIAVGSVVKYYPKTKK